MSLRADGSYRCDRCGADVDNGGVQMAAIISDLSPDEPGTVRVLHLCRETRDGAPNGCVGNALGPATLANWTEVNA